jgi:uncharacterized protein (UPF0548 family)
MDAEWIKSGIGLVALHGPWALLAFYLVTKLLTTTKREHELILAYQTLVTENTRVTERLAILIEERTRARVNGRH